MADYFVSLTGSDASAGTEVAPFASVQKACSVATTGSKIYMRGGVYGTTDTVGTNGIWMAGGTKYIQKNDNIMLEAFQDEPVEIQLPSDTTAANLFYIGGDWLFNKVNFANRRDIPRQFVYCNNGAAVNNIVIQDGYIEGATVNGGSFSLFNTATYDNSSMSFKRMKIKNGYYASTLFTNNVPASAAAISLSMEGCLVKDWGKIYSGEGVNKVFNLNFRKNTVVDLKTSDPFVYIMGNNTVDMSDNIIVLNAVNVYAMYLRSALTASWNVKNNIIYKNMVITDGVSNDLDSMFFAGLADFVTIDRSNLYIDPMFADPDNDDYTPTNPYVNGRGSVDSIVGGDITGKVWAGHDIGCHACASGTKTEPVLANGVAFVGDSIAWGIGENYAIAPHERLPGVGVGSGGAGIGGSGIQAALWLIDRAVLTWRPRFIVLETGNNSYKASGNVPTALTKEQVRDQIVEILAKCDYWGVIPIWAGMSGSMVTNGNAAQYTKPTEVNDLVEIYCAANGYRFTDILAKFRENANWYKAEADGGYYPAGGLEADVHPTYATYQAITVPLIKTVLPQVYKTITADYSPTGDELFGTPAFPATVVLAAHGLSVNFTGLTLSQNDVCVKEAGAYRIYNFTRKAGTTQYVYGSNSGGSGGGIFGSNFS